jgi:hypothetical protein
LIVDAYDLNKWCFLLSYALVEEEMNNNLAWFLDLIRRHVMGRCIGLCLISDKHAAIKNIMSQI